MGPLSSAASSTPGVLLQSSLCVIGLHNSSPCGFLGNFPRPRAEGLHHPTRFKSHSDSHIQQRLCNNEGLTRPKFEGLLEMHSVISDEL